MQAKSTLLDFQLPVESKTIGSISPGRSWWQPSVEFLLSMALIGDALVVFGALAFAFWVRFDSGLIPISPEVKFPPTFFGYFRLLIFGNAFLLVTLAYHGLYSQRSFTRYLRVARVIVQGMIFWFFTYLAGTLILKFDPSVSRGFMLTAFVCGTGSMLIWRLAFHKITRLGIFALNLRQRVLFVGWGRDAERLEREIQNDADHPYEIIGCLSSPQGKLSHELPKSVRYFGEYQSLSTLLAQRCADIVILADPYIKMDEIIEMANQCEMEFVHFKVIPSYFKILASGLRLETISGVPVLGVTNLPLNHFSNRLIKRVIDMVGAFIGLFLSLPLIAFFGLLVYLESPGPIFYRQTRMGKNGRNFHIFKIRSMRVQAEQNGVQWAKENDPRRLRIGAFMRKWNIDEIPQFLNVLKGDMSLVGPRPERPELILNFKHQIPHYHARHTCLPGMSGWAQVNGWRGNTSLDERIRFDIWYVENWSVALDVRIMLLTFLRQKNAY